MPRQGNGSGPMAHLGQVPITVGFAGAVIIALMLLVILRHLFASVNISAGAK